MKRIEYIIRLILILLIIQLLNAEVKAQGINDLGVVWQKTYPSISGSPVNMKSNKKGGYIVAGRDDRNGTIMEINESGDIINNCALKIDLSTIYTANNPNSSTAMFNVAFRTDDGGILAFGSIRDMSAPNADKMTNYTGDPTNASNALLLKGCWVVKYDKDYNVVKNERLLGARLAQGWQLTNGNFLIVGMDRPREEVAGTSNDISLVRIYDQNGNLVKDGRANYSEITSIYQYPNSDNFVMSSSTMLMKVNAANNNIIISDAKNVVSMGLTDMIAPYVTSVTPSSDGGAFFFSNLNSNVNVTINNQNGKGFYRLAPDYNQMYYKISKPRTEDFNAPLLLEGNRYVGTYRKQTESFNRMYQLIDNGAFNTTIGSELPLGGVINLVSSTDGFFAIGSSGDHQSVVKLSTCANFKIKDGDLPANNTIYIDHSGSINFRLPLNYEGAKAPALNKVTYDLSSYVESGTVNSKTSSDNGGLLEELTNQPVQSFSSGSGKVIDFDKTYTIGNSGVVIKYILIIKDSYTTAGVNQSCSQTYVFYLKSVPQTDVVAMPMLRSEGANKKVTAAIKNIGQAPFIDYKITIYDNALGSATKYSYTHPNSIGMSETTRFNIDLSNTPVANSSKIVVSFNDDGSGNQNQTEIEQKQFIYELTL